MTQENLNHYIAGEWSAASDGKTLLVENPANQELAFQIPTASSEDIQRALQAAKASFSLWSKQTTHYQRSKVLRQTSDLIRKNKDDLAMVTTIESGKPLEESKGEWEVAAHIFDWFSEECKRIYGRTIPSQKPGHHLTVTYQPVGVVASITAWNYPAYNPARSWAAALAAGCTLVAKPSEITPVSALKMAKLLEEAGLPGGVLNVLVSEPTKFTNTLMAPNAAHKLSFTGSLRVGKELIRQSAEAVMGLALELGGNAPAIIFDDVDPAAVAELSVQSKFRNCGQICISPQRFLIHQSIYKDFLDRASALTSDLRVGPGTSSDTQVGPMITDQQRQRVLNLIDSMKEQEGRVVCGGKIPGNPKSGFFLQPTVIELTGPGRESKIFREELFGPVMLVNKFSSLDEAIEVANDTPYGLAAYVFAKSPETKQKCAEQLDAGIIGINTFTPHGFESPFGGWKQSGLGRECGEEGIYEYLEEKLVGERI